ncbi:hypothetical protein PHSY_005489 [Pseudozyma hubeiensis SY62]|uniref:T6SS Phospholipase effector Tle1-like catalytic domain-containing protein n=1 Tax=Pseudozyma hubeiensis (strain SY62) TaxID=1305764 RepID=R9P968_PSEHS|nr:hypothetical protein PHSY_005489 [Pseudozyma hubeiensis SY62]GAC97901.1 hypothetical protein PHSY_005489 [Pseudozyma hubeiensis SY62]
MVAPPTDNPSPPPLTTNQPPFTSLPPPPVQARIPRQPIRIIVLCDGTGQARNWVKASLNTATQRRGPFSGRRSSLAASDHDDRTCVPPVDRGDVASSAARQRRKNKSKSSASTATPSPAAESGEFFTNVALLAKCIASSSGVAPTSPTTSSPTLDSASPGVMPQIVFYQSGIGTGTGKIQNLFDQGTGLSLGSKIQEAYSFIVDNYQPGDELFFFGFSRGAYTARCITGFINWCGVLSKVEMTHFADIWSAYQKRDPDDVASESAAAEVLFAATKRYPSIESEGFATSTYQWNLSKNDHLSEQARTQFMEARRKELEERRKHIQIVPPQIKVVGVWDTVSALGFPGMFQDNAMIDFFDFYDPGLGSNIQFGFHALSLEEDRKDFLPTMWYQPSVNDTPKASSEQFGVRGKHMRSKQLLKQCWFQGAHSDVGGGYQYHGLSDLTLIWMVSQLVDPQTLPDGSTTLRPLLNIDIGLLATILDRRREWAMQLAHKSRPTINYQKFRTVNQRKFDEDTMRRSVWENMALTGRTNESIHASVVRGGRIDVNTHPAFGQMRELDRQGLDRLWAEAQDWESALRPTEKLLYWDRRAPYPWIAGVGDAYLNPLLAPLTLSGGWFIPELEGTGMRDVVIGVAQERKAAKSMDGDTPPSVDPSDSTTTGSPHLTLSLTTTSLPYIPLIPSKELGENPIDPTHHPHLYTLWNHLNSLSTIPNALLTYLCNLSIIDDTNLNLTKVQDLLWTLGDKVGGYEEAVKRQALLAGLPAEREGKKGRERRFGKKGRKDSSTTESG